MNTILKIVVLVFLLGSCKNKEEIKKRTNETNSSVYYKEPYRPQFHFSPEEKWMNDPNGMVFYKGVYHLFYQYYPEDIVWGPMHWGHATSKDLVHWKHKPIALYPDQHGLIFSGSAVVDYDNTSGFGTKENPPLVAIYTYHLMEGEKAGRKDFQTQGIAYSLDNGDTWTKYKANPVIGNTGIKDFRDPKVIWHEATKQWILTLVAGDHAKFYSSKNLKEWKLLSEFGKERGAHGGVWECPDLFPIKVEGTDEEKWVLIISINPGAPNGGSGTQYFIGNFDGTSFSSNQKETKWIDYGTDNYAGVTYSNAPNNELIFIGWMSNWTYARDTPTEKWRSAMTFPRKLSLNKFSNEYFLYNYPVSQLNSITGKFEPIDFDLASADKKVIKNTNFNKTEVKFKTTLQELTFGFKNNLAETLELGVSTENKTFFLNRKFSGKIDFQEDFGKKIQEMPIPNLPKEEFEVRILVDASSIEVFLNKGQYVMTAQLFPNETYSELYFLNETETKVSINNLTIKPIHGIW